MNRITEKLWFRPLIFCLLSILELIAKVADSTRLHELVPKINTESGDFTWYPSQPVC
jgi:hypothetical protein